MKKNLANDPRMYQSINNEIYKDNSIDFKEQQKIGFDKGNKRRSLSIVSMEKIKNQINLPDANI